MTRIDEDYVHVDRTREHVVGAPADDPDLVYEQDDYGAVYGYWGHPPFWTPGYMYPRYPSYEYP